MLFGLIQLNNPVINMVYSISGIISGIQGSLAAGDRILKVLDAAPEPERYPAPAGLPGEPPSGRLSPAGLGGGVPPGPLQLQRRAAHLAGHLL